MVMHVKRSAREVGIDPVPWASVRLALLRDAERGVLYRVDDAHLESLPYRLRYLLAWNHDLCRAVLGVYARSLARRPRRGGSACESLMPQVNGAGLR